MIKTIIIIGTKFDCMDYGHLLDIVLSAKVFLKKSKKKHNKTIMPFRQKNYLLLYFFDTVRLTR